MQNERKARFWVAPTVSALSLNLQLVDFLAASQFFQSYILILLFLFSFLLASVFLLNPFFFVALHHLAASGQDFEPNPTFTNFPALQLRPHHGV